MGLEKGRKGEMDGPSQLVHSSSHSELDRQRHGGARNRLRPRPGRINFSELTRETAGSENKEERSSGRASLLTFLPDFFICDIPQSLHAEPELKKTSASPRDSGGKLAAK